MNAELTRQFDHTWRIFSSIVAEHDDHAWLSTGRGSMTPARLALHILQGAKYYMQDASFVLFESGKAFDVDPQTANEAELPSPEDILDAIRHFRAFTAQWLNEIDLEAENSQFPWAGQTQMGVALFLLRHTIYHVGELSSLLNEKRSGQTKDHWISTL